MDHFRKGTIAANKKVGFKGDKPENLNPAH
jgi:hypothetical protein